MDSQMTVQADIHRTPIGDVIRSASVPKADAELPPYPDAESLHPAHCRQPSDEFPPPPPPQELLQALSGDSVQQEADPVEPEASGLLAALQKKRQQILGIQMIPATSEAHPASGAASGAASGTASGGRNWLQELQAKQAALQHKKKSSTSFESVGSASIQFNSIFTYFTLITRARISMHL